jgi:hypothetical protein
MIQLVQPHHVAHAHLAISTWSPCPNLVHAILDVAAQVDPFESKGLKSGLHLIGSMVGSPGAFKLWVNWIQLVQYEQGVNERESGVKLQPHHEKSLPIQVMIATDS